MQLIKELRQQSGAPISDVKVITYPTSAISHKLPLCNRTPPATSRRRRHPCCAVLPGGVQLGHVSSNGGTAPEGPRSSSQEGVQARI
jgi:hypothetical protein